MNDGITAKKKYGQNFIVNPGICPKMIKESGLDGDYGVLEIGPGLGALTAELARTAKKVVAVEIDGDLIPTLRGNLSEFRNVEIIEGDVMKLPLGDIVRDSFDGMPVAVFGNLPYYITSPIIMRLLEEKLPVGFICAMVQKEAARRLCAKEGDRDSGAVTMAVRYYSEPEILFDVSPGSFRPVPSVTSSVVKFTVRTSPVRPADEKKMFSVIKSAFAMRRKTALNSISSSLGLSKQAVENALSLAGIKPSARAEELTLADYAAISDRL